VERKNSLIIAALSDMADIRQLFEDVTQCKAAQDGQRPNIKARRDSASDV